VQFCLNCYSHNIRHEGTICRLFTLTFEGWVKGWCETFPTTSIHTWEKFTHDFLDAFANYNYVELCQELLNLRKKPDESLDVFSLRFKCIIFKFHLEDIPPIDDFLPQLLALSNEKN
jgi:hypothetical protein